MADFIETEEIKLETNNNFVEMCKTTPLEDFQKIYTLYIGQYIPIHGNLSIPKETRKINAAKWLYDTYGLSVRHISGLPNYQNYSPFRNPLDSESFPLEHQWRVFQIRVLKLKQPKTPAAFKTIEQRFYPMCKA